MKDNFILFISYDFVYVVIFDWFIFMELYDFWGRFIFDFDCKFGFIIFFRCEIFNGDYKLWGSNSLDIEIWNIVKVSFTLIWLIKILKYFIVLF